MSGSVNVSGTITTGNSYKAPFNGIYANPSTIQPASLANANNYAPYDATTAPKAASTRTITGNYNLFFDTVASGQVDLICNNTWSTNMGIFSTTPGNYVIYTIPATMTMAYINYAGVVYGGPMEVYGDTTLLCTINTYSPLTGPCISPVNVSGYTTLKIINTGTYCAILGIGWTIAPTADWKSQQSVDVNGSLNATGLNIISTSAISANISTSFTVTMPASTTTILYTFTKYGIYLVSTQTISVSNQPVNIGGVAIVIVPQESGSTVQLMYTTVYSNGGTFSLVSTSIKFTITGGYAATNSVSVLKIA